MKIMDDPKQKIVPRWEIDDAMRSLLRYPGDFVSKSEYEKLYKQYCEKCEDKQ